MAFEYYWERGSLVFFIYLKVFIIKFIKNNGGHLIYQPLPRVGPMPKSIIDGRDKKREGERKRWRRREGERGREGERYCVSLSGWGT